MLFISYSFIEYDTDGDFDGYEDTMRLSNFLTEEEEEEEEIYPMPDDQVQDDTDEVNAPESRDNFQIPFGPHRKFSRENELYSTKEEFKMCKKQNLFAVLICCLLYFKLDAKHLDALLYHLLDFILWVCYHHCELNMLLRTYT